MGAELMSLVFMQWIAWVLVPGSFLMFICEIGERFGMEIVRSPERGIGFGDG